MCYLRGKTLIFILPAILWDPGVIIMAVPFNILEKNSSRWPCICSGIKEAPDHVASIRAEYYTLSQEWHAFLGFEIYSLANSQDRNITSNSLKRPYSI
jgi:hypothetical protein